jgi:hypothetical protein
MCTIVFYKNDDYNVMAFNRDMYTVSKQASTPVEDQIKDGDSTNQSQYWKHYNMPYPITAPIDSGWGTPAAVNSEGVGAAIIENFQTPKEKRPQKVPINDKYTATNGELPITALAYPTAKEAMEAMKAQKATPAISKNHGQSKFNLKNYRPHFLLLYDKKDAYALEYDGISQEYKIHELSNGITILDNSGVNGVSPDGKLHINYLHKLKLASETLPKAMFSGEAIDKSQANTHLKNLLKRTDTPSQEVDTFNINQTTTAEYAPILKKLGMRDDLNKDDIITYPSAVTCRGFRVIKHPVEGYEASTFNSHIVTAIPQGLKWESDTIPHDDSARDISYRSLPIARSPSFTNRSPPSDISGSIRL